MKPTPIASAQLPVVQPSTVDVDLSTLPKNMDRRAAAELVTRIYFPVSHRSLEAWPLVTRRVNGRALVEVREVLAVAKAMFDAAPPTRGGRHSSTAGS
jgi:hypothetical protein